MQRAVLSAKRAKGLTWESLASKVGLSELFVASCCYGENSMTRESADRLCTELDLGSDVRDCLLEYPTKGNSLEGKLIPTDPLLYRFYEILCVYGTSLKDVIQEKCGNGIMSAVDFTLEVKKIESSKGDRVVVYSEWRNRAEFLNIRRTRSPHGCARSSRARDGAAPRHRFGFGFGGSALCPSSGQRWRGYRRISSRRMLG